MHKSSLIEQYELIIQYLPVAFIFQLPMFMPIALYKHAKISRKGSSGIWTRDLSHPKRESYP